MRGVTTDTSIILIPNAEQTVRRLLRAGARGKELLLMSINLSAIINNHLEIQPQQQQQQQRQLLLLSVSQESCQSHQTAATNPRDRCDQKAGKSDGGRRTAVVVIAAA